MRVADKISTNRAKEGRNFGLRISDCRFEIEVNGNHENACPRSSARIPSRLGDYVTIRRTRHSGRVRLSGRDPESSESSI